MAYKGLTGRLKVSIVSTGKYVMPYFLADFMKVNSGLNCKWMLPIRVDVIGLEKNEIDFALVSVPASLNIEKLDLLQNKLFWLPTAN
jgi:hypothetical protein